MSKIIKFVILGLGMTFLCLGSNNLAFAKVHGGHAKKHAGKGHAGTTPSGWHKGKKKGWEGGNQPPGWDNSKKEEPATS